MDGAEPCTACRHILLVRDKARGRVVIADGYHRLCAVYTFDEDALIPCKIVNVHPGTLLTPFDWNWRKGVKANGRQHLREARRVRQQRACEPRALPPCHWLGVFLYFTVLLSVGSADFCDFSSQTAPE